MSIRPAASHELGCSGRPTKPSSGFPSPNESPLVTLFAAPLPPSELASPAVTPASPLTLSPPSPPSWPAWRRPSVLCRFMLESTPGKSRSPPNLPNLSKSASPPSALPPHQPHVRPLGRWDPPLREMRWGRSFQKRALRPELTSPSRAPSAGTRRATGEQRGVGGWEGGGVRRCFSAGARRRAGGLRGRDPLRAEGVGAVRRGVSVPGWGWGPRVEPGERRRPRTAPLEAVFPGML